MENLKNRLCVTVLNPYFIPEWGWENLIHQRWIPIHLLICPSSKVKSTETFLSQQQPSLSSFWSGHQSLVKDIWLVDFPRREWRLVFKEYLTLDRYCKQLLEWIKCIKLMFINHMSVHVTNIFNFVCNI